MDLYRETIEVFCPYLIKNYMKENRVKSLANAVFSESFITIDDLEDINKTVVTTEKTRKLTEKLLRENNLNYERLYRVILNELTDDRSNIREVLENVLHETEAKQTKQTSQLNDRFYETLQKSYAYIINSYNVESDIEALANLMISEDFIDLDDIEEIGKTVLNKEKMAKLLQAMLRQKGTLSYERVYTVLVNEISENRPDVADELRMISERTLEVNSAGESETKDGGEVTDVSEVTTSLTKTEPHEKNTFTTTSLIEASYRGSIEEVKTLLLEGRTNVNTAKSDGWTPLMFASDRGHTNIVSLLLKQTSIDVNATDVHGSTALIEASYERHPSCIKLLLDHKDIRVNAAKSDGVTALMFAASNSTSSLSLLLDHPDIVVNLSNKDGMTALMYAVLADRVDTVILLLNRVNIDLNLRNHAGQTVLDLATIRGNKRIVKKLDKHLNKKNDTVYRSKRHFSCFR